MNVKFPEITIETSRDCKPIGIIYPSKFVNGCCKDKPYVLTVNLYGGALNYSCQCACNMWCTNGHDNPGGAINEYEEMCKNAAKEKKFAFKW